MSPIAIDTAFQSALQLHQAGQLTQAQSIYRQIIDQHPRHPGALLYLGVIAQQTGLYEKAVELMRQAISVRPDFAAAHCNLAVALKDLGRLDESIAASRQAIGLKPQFAEAYNNLGDALCQSGQSSDAIEACRKALAIQPIFPEAYNNLGNALRDGGQVDQAIEAYRQAVAQRPLYPQACNNLGIALQEKGQLDEAIAIYRRAIALDPRSSEGHNNLGNALRKLGQPDDAIDAYRRAIELRPNYAEAHNNLGNALRDKGQLNEAITAYEQASAHKPDYYEAYNNLGNVLKDMGQRDAAMAAYHRAIALKPSCAEVQNNLGNLLKDMGQIEEAISAYNRAIEIQPFFAEAFDGLGSILKNKGQIDEAIMAYRQAIAIKPGFAMAHSNLAFAIHYDPSYSAEDIARELHRWNRQHAEPLNGLIHPHLNSHDPERKLRIGYVSPDFKEHPVGRFLVPLLAHHDKGRFEIFAYAQVRVPDGITSQLRSYADCWRNIVGVSDAEVANLIREDGVDILVDLTLHTAENRLLVFARKPAPIQVSWLGYPGSTGLTAIDYRLSDQYIDPPGPEESLDSERVMRLRGCFWCYDPLDAREIPVNSLPLLKSSSLTFGSLNSFCKYNEITFALWAQVLRQVPGSRLLLLADPGTHVQQALQWCERQGIEPDRVQFRPRQSRRGYLELYNQVDLGLDTLPYNGHTTTLDSLWMGVPVVTLVGKTTVGRAGASILSNLGLGELVAHSERQFVQIATELARDTSRLSSLRSELRQKMESSPLMDGAGFARDIEAAYRTMWHAWCEASASS